MRVFSDKYLEADSVLKEVNKRIHKIYRLMESIDKWIVEFSKEKTDD